MQTSGRFIRAPSNGSCVIICGKLAPKSHSSATVNASIAVYVTD